MGSQVFPWGQNLLESGAVVTVLGSIRYFKYLTKSKGDFFFSVQIKPYFLISIFTLTLC